MSLPRPLNFLLLCLGLLLVQLVISAFHGSRLWGVGASWTNAVLVVGLIAGVLHIALLLRQLPQALRWKPRRSIRPSPEVKAAHRRLSRELHDRIGSRLVNALSMVDEGWANSTNHRAALEQILLELRTVVDSMDAPDRTPQEQLTQLRHRVKPVFARQGIALDWALDGAEMPDTHSQAVLVLVAQEALSNVLQHARARRVQVTLRPECDGAQWVLEVSDDGGVGADSLFGKSDSGAGVLGWTSGSGMENMRERLAEVGGTLFLQASPLGGACVRAVVLRTK